MRLSNLPDEHEQALRSLLRQVGYSAPIFTIPSHELVDLDLAVESQYQQAILLTRSVRENLRVDEKIYICVVKSPEIQALAARLEGGVYCVVLFSGALVSLPMSVNYVSEAPELSVFWELDAEGQIKGALNSGITTFLVAHELAHIINGHLLLDAVPHNASFIIDRQNTYVPFNDELVTSHVLEVDADAFGVGVLLRTFLTPGNYPEIVHDLPFWTRIHMVAMIVFCIFRVWDADSLPVESTFETDHPQSQRRLIIAIGVMRRICEKAGITFPYGYWASQVTNVMAVVHVVWRKRFGIDESEHSGALFVDNAYLGVVSRRWAEIRPELIRLKLGEHSLAPVRFFG